MAKAKQSSKSESPDVVYGRLMESVHISGYTLERAVNECLWLASDERWKSLGFESASAFVRSIDLSEFRMAAEKRKELAVLLAEKQVSQRATAKALGVDSTTVRRDLGARDDAAAKAALMDRDDAETQGADTTSAANAALPPYDPDPAGGRKAAAAVQTKAARAQREHAREGQRQANAAAVAGVSDPRELLKIGRFSTIAIDPPWDLGDEGDVNQLGRAKQNYASMSLDELLVLPVDLLADGDCHLYLWITNRSLPKGFRLIEAWGFRYVTCLTWVKPSFGMGNYFRGQTEHVLFGIRGSQPLQRKDASTVFEAPRGPDGHSSKPDAFYELAESCSPGPYLEMFGRRERSGWTVWGEHATGS